MKLETALHRKLHITVGLLMGSSGGRQMYLLESTQLGLSKAVRGGKYWFYYQMGSIEVKAVGTIAKKHPN